MNNTGKNRTDDEGRTTMSDETYDYAALDAHNDREGLIQAAEEIRADLLRFSNPPHLTDPGTGIRFAVAQAAEMIDILIAMVYPDKRGGK